MQRRLFQDSRTRGRIVSWDWSPGQQRDGGETDLVRSVSIISRKIESIEVTLARVGATDNPNAERSVGRH